MKALCKRGLDTAGAAGADHAGARVVERRAPRVATWNGRVETVLDGETAGVEVGVLVEGTRGFASTSRLGAPAAHHAAFRAIGFGGVDAREGLGIARERRCVSTSDVATTSFRIGIGIGIGARPVTRAPDRIEPVVGWRVWDVVELEGELRLCSLNFWTIWLPGHPTAAVCRRALADVNRVGLPPHAAPSRGCTCGVYAARTAGHVLSHARRFRLRGDAVHRVVGRVDLWGRVVEADRGWRGELAYPETLFVPAVRSRILRPGRLPAPRRSVERIAAGLAGYGAPVEVLDCDSYARLAALLEPDDPD